MKGGWMSDEEYLNKRMDMIIKNSHYGLHPEQFSLKKISEEKEKQYKIQAAMRVAFWRVWVKEHRRPEGAYAMTDIYKEGLDES